MSKTDLKMGRASLIVAITLVFGLMGFGTRSAVAQTISPNSIAVTSTQVDPEAAADDAAIDADLDADLDDTTDLQVAPARLPLPINVQGPWSGSITDDVMGAGTINITIAQKNRNLSGGWTVVWPSDPQMTGNFKGRANAHTIRLHLASAQFTRKVCRLNFVSTTASGTGITGNYRWVNCGKQFRGNKGGTIDILPTP